MPLDVVCLGEALVDFLPERRGRRIRDVLRWTPQVGGAPANVAVGIARLGGRSALVGVTGDDEFGSLLLERLALEGVETRGMRQTREGKTGLGFVSLTREGERSFTFYRQQSAESFLSPADVRRAGSLLAGARVLHLGTNSLLRPPARAAAFAALRGAVRRGQLVSCDPNLRLHLWPKPEVLRRLLGRLLPLCAVVKLSEEEIAFVTGTADVDAALARLEAWGVLLPLVTLGARGAAWRFQGRSSRVPAPRVRVVDTTGAGDGFTAGLLRGLTVLAHDREALARVDPRHLRQLVAAACAVGSRVVGRLGATPGLPTVSELPPRHRTLLTGRRAVRNRS